MKVYDTSKYFFATIVPGLERILADELKELGIEAETITISRGKVFFQMPKREVVSELFKLRCADNIYSIVAEFPVGLHKIDLEQFAIAFGKLDWRRISCTMDIDSNEIRVSASRNGKHTYSRFDIEKVAEDVLIRKGFIKTEDDINAIRIRVDICDCFCLIAIKLTDAEFRFRGKAHIYTAGNIRPTIAAALIKISNPQREDVFYDMFCGSGTIPKERDAFPARRILASDIDGDIIHIEKENCSGQAIILYCCDARNTLSKSDSVDVIVSNPPWNKQVQLEDAKQFYIDFFREAKRILKPKGRMILLTNCHEEVIIAAHENRMQCRALYSLSLHGLRPKIYKIQEDE